MDERTIVNELHHGSTHSSLACTSCRKKKLKCDRSVPQCHNCEKVSRACEYPETAQKPGPRPGFNRRANGTARTNASKRRSIASKVSPSNGTSSHSDIQPSSEVSDAYQYSGDMVNGAGSQSQLHAGRPSYPGFSAANGTAFTTACQRMGLTEEACLNMIEVYFEYMTAFSLFHEPTFTTKLSNIDSPKQLQALLTTMLAFSVHFMDGTTLGRERNLQSGATLDQAHALSVVCLDECGDETPPLHLLQSYILQTWMYSTHGVRGKAWRLSGQAIRMAYELRLHELDVDLFDRDISMEKTSATNPQEWILVEEKRRAWWALWECDIFGSTIQRLPIAIDWTRSRTNLPVTDEDWFNGRPAQSCHFKVDPNRRWRDLRNTGNTSPTAWFIILNSYKWESLAVTQRIAPPTTLFDDESHLKERFDASEYKPILARKREILENCLRCALGAIPQSLQTETFLTFELSRGRHRSLTRVRHHGIYMIQIISQVTQLLLFRRDLEGGNYIAYPADFSQPTTARGDQIHNVLPHGYTDHKRWQRCLLVADRMASIVRNASPNHYQYVNPNAATALWMAAATQLAVLASHRDEIDVDLAQSNFDLLTTTIESFIDFWDVPATLIQSLATLQQQLKGMNQKMGDGSNGVNGGANNEPAQNVSRVTGTLEQARQAVADMSGLTNGDQTTYDLSPFDVLQAMDFGAMYNGIDNWENIFLDPGFPAVENAI